MKLMILSAIIIASFASTFSVEAKYSHNVIGNSGYELICINSESDGTGVKSESDGTGVNSESDGTGVKSESDGTGVKSESDGTGVKSYCMINKS